VQMKPAIQKNWDYKVEASVSIESSLHILLRFMMNGELTSYDAANFFDENLSSSIPGTVLCSTISPETQKFKRLRSHWDYQDDDWSIKRKMPLGRAQSGPQIIQSSATSSRSFLQADHGISIREQLVHIGQFTHGSEETSSETSDSVNSMPEL